MLREAQPTTWVDELATYCVNLTSFEYNSISTCHFCPGLVHLCERLGPRLKTLIFPQLHHLPYDWQLNIILDACPNLRIDIDAATRNADSLAVFRNRLRVACILDRGMIDAEESGNSLRSVEELRISVSNVRDICSFLSKFFLSPKPALKSLTLICGGHAFYKRLESFGCACWTCDGSRSTFCGDSLDWGTGISSYS